MPAQTPRAAGGTAPKGTAYVADILAANVRGYRRLRGLEQDDVAGRMQTLGHVTWRPVTVSEVERGLRNVSVTELVDLVVVLGATIEQLLDPRGPVSRAGPRMLLAAHPDYADLTRRLAVAPEHVTALVCAHKYYAEPHWNEVLLRSIKYVDARPEPTHGEPDDAAP
jgi:transcriptional regulator with XRE-family HTH domain